MSFMILFNRYLSTALLGISLAVTSLGGNAQTQQAGAQARPSLLVPALPASSASSASAQVVLPSQLSASAALKEGIRSSASSVSAAIAAAAAGMSLPQQPQLDKEPAQRTRLQGAVATGSATQVPGAEVQRPAPSVQRKPDGTQVFKTPVSAAMVEEEQRVAALNQPPAVSASTRGQTGPNPVTGGSPGKLAAFLGADAALPNWASEGVAKTNGKTRLVVSQGVTEMVTIAKNFPNRFITPFDAAEVVTTDENLSHEGYGGAVILATSGDRPIGIFIQDKFSDRSISLVLVPETVPQRELRLVLDETWVAPVLRQNPEANDVQLPSAQNDYVEFVKATLRALAKGEVPDGHALTPLDAEQVPKCQIPGIAVKAAQMLEGPTTRIGVYVATNTAASALPVQEAGCYRRGVLAVSAFPNPVLEPNQSTEVYVLMRKDMVTRTVTGKRRPVLVTQ